MSSPARRSQPIVFCVATIDLIPHVLKGLGGALNSEVNYMPNKN